MGGRGGADVVRWCRTRGIRVHKHPPKAREGLAPREGTPDRGSRVPFHEERGTSGLGGLRDEWENGRRELTPPAGCEGSDRGVRGQSLRQAREDNAHARGKAVRRSGLGVVKTPGPPGLSGRTSEPQQGQWRRRQNRAHREVCVDPPGTHDAQVLAVEGSGWQMPLGRISHHGRKPVGLT